MRGDAMLGMPLHVLIALWLLNRRAMRRQLKSDQVIVQTINLSDELAIFGRVDAWLSNRGWIERALLWAISGRRSEVELAAKLGWMAVGKVKRNP